MNKVPRWVFRYVGNKTFDFSSKKKDFLPKNDQIWPKTGIFGQFGPGHAGLFSALLVGRLVVVARRLYLARHLFTLFHLIKMLAFPLQLQLVFSLARRSPESIHMRTNLQSVFSEETGTFFQMISILHPF